MAPPLPQDGMNLHFKNPEPHLSIVTTGVTLNQVELSDEALHLINLNLLVAQKLKRFTCQRYGNTADKDDNQISRPTCGLGGQQNDSSISYPFCEVKLTGTI